MENKEQGLGLRITVFVMPNFGRVRQATVACPQYTARGGGLCKPDTG